MKLDRNDRRDLRTKLNHLAKTAIDCIDYCEYESDVMVPYALRRLDQLFEEVENLKTTLSALKRRDMQHVVTAFDEEAA